MPHGRIPGVSIVARDRRSQLGAAAHRDTSVRRSPSSLRARHTTFVLRVTQALNYPAATCQPRGAYGYRIAPPAAGPTVSLPTGPHGFVPSLRSSSWSYGPSAQRPSEPHPGALVPLGNTH